MAHNWQYQKKCSTASDKGLGKYYFTWIAPEFRGRFCTGFALKTAGVAEQTEYDLKSGCVMVN